MTISQISRTVLSMQWAAARMANRGEVGVKTRKYTGTCTDVLCVPTKVTHTGMQNPMTNAGARDRIRSLRLKPPRSHMLPHMVKRRRERAAKHGLWQCSGRRRCGLGVVVRRRVFQAGLADGGGPRPRLGCVVSGLRPRKLDVLESFELLEEPHGEQDPATRRWLPLQCESGWVLHASTVYDSLYDNRKPWAREAMHLWG